MEEKTTRALHWIVSILNKHNITYRIGGGFAAWVYGAPRPIKDIDISLPGKFFSVLLPEVKEYIVSGPKHYTDQKWDCDSLSLNYYGQEIDLTDIDTLRMSNKERTKWIQTKEMYQKFPNQIMNVAGVEVSLIDPRDLVSYKRELDGDHQVQDIEAVCKYINENVPLDN